MKRKLATTLGLAGGATLLLAILAGPATGAGTGPIGMGQMDQDRDQVQVRRHAGGSAGGLLPLSVGAPRCAWAGAYITSGTPSTTGEHQDALCGAS